MNRHVRILLLSRDRYAAYRLEKTLESRFPDSIVVVFHSVEGAVEEVTRNRYHLAVVDYATVGQAGLDRLHSGNQQLPIIALTDSELNSLTDRGDKPFEDSIRWVSRTNRLETILPQTVQQTLRLDRLRGERLPGPPTGNSIGRADDIVNAVGRLTHNVNNPLMTIVGTTELLLDEAHLYDETLLRRLRVIRQSADRIAASLDDLTQQVAGKKPGLADSGEAGRVIGPPREGHVAAGSENG